MNRIDRLFSEKKNILSIYFTAGFPQKGDTMEIIQSLDRHGADLIEIGMPFSDPVADGPVIQASSRKAISNGMNLEVLFNQLKELRKLTEIPVILMGYLNPVYRMGMKTFLQKCRQAGVDGLILPDLPPETWKEEYRQDFEDFGIRNILLITPQTSEIRIQEIDRLSGGFIYMVSSYSTTGRTGEFDQEQVEYFERIRRMGLKNPTLVGFGISGKTSFETACQYASGGIIGTAFIRALEKPGTTDSKISEFIQSIKA